MALIVTVLMWLNLSTTANARSYQITNYRINVQIKKNGDASVTQRVRYHFKGAFNGVYLNQDYAGTGGIKGTPTVAITTVQRTSQARMSQSGRMNTYQVSDNGSRYRMKVFYPVQDETVTYTYHYQLRQVIKSYQDTAELNWKIIGAGWDVPLQNVKITVQLPDQNIRKLQAWAHGPLSGSTKVDRKDGRVTMTVSHVDAKQFVESHMVFPNSVVPNNQHRSSEKKLKQIQRQEAKLATEANQKRQRQRLIPMGISLICFVLALGYTIWQLLWFRRHDADHVVQTPKVHNFDIPNYSAVTSQSILSRTLPDSQALSAWLLELAAAGELKIEAENDDEEKPTYRITTTDKLTMNHQQDQLLKFLFDQVGDQQSVTIKQIQDYGDEDQQQLADHFEKWQDEQWQVTDELGILDKRNASVSLHAWLFVIFNSLLCFGALVAGVFAVSRLFVITSVVLSLVLAVTGIVIAARKLWHLSPYTQAGEEIAGPIRNFKQMLKDIGQFDRSEVGDLIIWEQMLPFAVSFGYAKRVVKAMKANFSAVELAPTMGIYYPLFFYGTGFDDNFGDAFSDSFSSAIETDSSTSGDGGGFSGGSSGGFGGGSGGGAF